jgi:acetoin utilization deacetylase AcuC-like enzyme
VRYWETRLNWIVRALAQPADEQRRLVPDFADAAEDLAVEFEASLIGAELYNEPYANAPPIVALNEQFKKMSLGAEPSVWTDADLFSSQSWERVRVLARAAVEALGWAADSPGPDANAVYVGPPSGTPTGGS